MFIDSAKGRKGGKHCCGGRTIIHRSKCGCITSHKGAGDGRSTTKGDGNAEV